MKAGAHSFRKVATLNRRRRRYLTQKLAKRRQRDRREVLFFQQQQPEKKKKYSLSIDRLCYFHSVTLNRFFTHPQKFYRLYICFADMLCVICSVCKLNVFTTL